MPKVVKWRFFLDQDSGMRAACLAAFKDEIKTRTCDAFFVRIAKHKTIDQKRAARDAAITLFKAQCLLHPDLTHNQVIQLILSEELAKRRAVGQWNDQWLNHPLPTMSEPEKAVCYLTDFGDYDLDHLAMLFNKASLQGVDTFFNRTRRRSAMLERPLHSQANAGRIWNGYGAYRPEHAMRMLEILRVTHNYILVGKDKKTPAMRLGLAMAPIKHGDIIHFLG
jgi:hypothetical protein